MLCRLQCELCGAKSGPADPLALSPRDRQMLDEFRAEHAGCAAGCAARPDGWAAPQVGAFGSPKAEPRGAPRPHGHFEYTGPYGELQTGDTLSCCHCRRHWEVRAGSGKTRGFCARCYDGTPGSGYTCGAPACDACVPYEVRLDNLDAGRPLLAPPAPAVPSGFGGAVLLGAGIQTEVAHGPVGEAAGSGGPEREGGGDPGLGLAPGGPGGGAAG